MEMALVAARRSLCKTGIGAVITTSDHRVITTGYNGPPSGFKHNDMPCFLWCERANRVLTDGGYTDCVSIHAEANALLASERSLRIGGTIFTTGEVCIGCAKLIANSGLACVVVLIDDAEYERRGCASTYQFMRECGIIVDRIRLD